MNAVTPFRPNPGPRPAMPRFAALPDNPAMNRLKAMPQWIVWAFLLNEKRDHWTKPPCSPVDGSKISATDPAKFASYEVAAAYVADHPEYGLGFSLQPGDGLRMDDLDDVIDQETGKPMFDWVAEALERGETYCEYSPSGTGLHFISEGKLAAAIKCDAAQVESYSDVRYMTMTGRAFPGAPLEIRESPGVLGILQARVAKFQASKKIPERAAKHDAATEKAPGQDKSFWRSVNTAALAALDAWVPKLYPSAVYQPGTRAWRVSSRDLGRNLEEDLSFAPGGIVDFGKEVPYSPIFIVEEHGGAGNPKEAAFWLCAQMGVTPASMGWSAPAAPKKKKAPPPDSAPWLRDCLTSSNGTPIANVANALLGMRSAPELQEIFAYDEMLRLCVLVSPVPDGKTEESDDVAFPRPVRDGDVTQVQEFLQHAGLPRIGKDIVHQAADLRAAERAFHPVRQYLNGVTWDGIERLGAWLTTYAGAEDSEYSRAVGAMFMVSAVARIFDPGVKVDHMLVLEGDQGHRKSTLCRILAGDWFSDSLPDVDKEKEAAQHLAGKWIIEVAEMHAMSRAEDQLLKKFISRQKEVYRPPYGRNEVHQPRQCVFIGTTNKDVYLRDETGGRRYWPVKISIIDTDAVARDRDQLFAEAVRMYRDGFRFWPDSELEKKHIQPQQNARYDNDVWEEDVQRYLLIKVAEQKEKAQVLVGEVLEKGLGIDTNRKSRADQKRVTDILRYLGWQRLKKDGNGNVPWGPIPEPATPATEPATPATEPRRDSKGREPKF